MNMAIQRKCQRLVATARSSLGHSFAYQCPVKKADRKREGRSFAITDGKRTITLDGHGIQVMARMLRNCGEIGSRINHKKTKVVVLLPSSKIGWVKSR
jgi:hypothetical protein